MKTIILTIGLLSIAQLGIAQNASSTQIELSDTSKQNRDKIFQFVDVMPTPGYSLGEYLSSEIKYPEAARRKNITGKVYVKFIVNEDGSISDITVIKGVNKLLDNEAVRVLSAMPKWKPGKQNGKYVKVYFTQPITFQLQ